MPRINKKHQTLIALFRSCQKSEDFVFNNDKVKEICLQTGFGNPFDVTKIDDSSKLPQEILAAGYNLVRLGDGYFCFTKAKAWYHTFERIDENQKQEWYYQPSLLNHTDASESNTISMVYNQKIIHDFLYGDTSAKPKIYLPRRTKITASFRVGGDEKIDVKNLQTEMDATFEHNGIVTVLEAKNGFPADFAVHQLFLPFLNYYMKDLDGVEKIQCCYLLKNDSVIRLYLYCFEDAEDIKSIALIKKTQYTLVVRDK